MSLVPTKRRRKSTKPTSENTSSTSSTRPSHSQQQRQHRRPNTPQDTEMNLETDISPSSTPSRTRQQQQRPLPPPPSPFLTLPLEIRRQIYSHLLLASPSHPILWPSPPASPGKPRSLHPAILLTNRQINSEASSLLYRNNRFSFHHPSDCNIFTHIMAQPLAHMLTSVVFRLRDRPADVALWSAYFGSVDGVRGLRADLPCVNQILVFLSQNWPGSGALTPKDAYEKWARNHAIRELRGSLWDIATGTSPPNDENDNDDENQNQNQSGDDNYANADEYDNDDDRMDEHRARHGPQIPRPPPSWTRHQQRHDRVETTHVISAQTNKPAQSTEHSPPSFAVDISIISTIRVGERLYDSLAVGLTAVHPGGLGVVAECARGVLRGTVVGGGAAGVGSGRMKGEDEWQRVRVCLEIVCVPGQQGGRER